MYLKYLNSQEKSISTEKRDIVLFDQESLDAILPTHYRILNILKIPRLLKILTLNSLKQREFI